MCKLTQQNIEILCEVESPVSIVQWSHQESEEYNHRVLSVAILFHF